jgi:hypothetical protein
MPLTKNVKNAGELWYAVVNAATGYLVATFDLATDAERFVKTCLNPERYEVVPTSSLRFGGSDD